MLRSVYIHRKYVHKRYIMTQAPPAEAHRVDDVLPLTPLSFHVLLTLAAGQAHGYGIAKAVEAQTKGGLRPGTGTLHNALQRLMQDGMIHPSTDPPVQQDDRRRSYYALTDFGVAVFRAEALRLAELVEAASETTLVPELERALGTTKE